MVAFGRPCVERYEIPAARPVSPETMLSSMARASGSGFLLGALRRGLEWEELLQHADDHAEEPEREKRAAGGDDHHRQPERPFVHRPPPRARDLPRQRGILIRPPGWPI